MALQETSQQEAVLVFKKSPICPTSRWAESELDNWLSARPESPALKLAVVDVIKRRALARGLSSALNITHESPQVLLFVDGSLIWHESHERINQEQLEQAVDLRRA
jgi:bacillithiol system protein YtxJ